MTMKVQRNEYITFMVIYASIALTAYLWILNYMYEKREKYEEKLIEAQNQSNEKKDPIKSAWEWSQWNLVIKLK